LAQIVGHVCLNRFHAATSLQTLSVTLWTNNFGPGALGRLLLAQHVEETLFFYIKESQNRNHMVAEAALFAMREFVLKLDNNVWRPYCAVLLNALLVSLADERWPVKDAACVCAGTLFRLCTEESFIDEFRRGLSLLSTLLKDCMLTVRDNAAAALGEAMQNASTSFSLTAIELVGREIGLHLMTAMPTEEGPDIPQSFSFLPSAMVRAAEAKKQVFGSRLSSQEIEALALMPAAHAMKKGWGCCIDCVDVRVTLPWERSHGSLCLVRELAAVSVEDLCSLQCVGRDMSAVQGMCALLTSTDYLDFDKLHSVVYKELPGVLLKLSATATTDLDVQKAEECIRKCLEECIQRYELDCALQ
jgi:hypothetical protein